MNSMSTVIATFAGQNEGAGRYDRIKKGVNFCLLICIAYSIVIGAVSMIFAQPITGIFTSGSSQQTIDYSVQFMFWNCPFEWSLAMLFIYRGTIQGLKNGIVPMIGSAYRSCYANYDARHFQFCNRLRINLCCRSCRMDRKYASYDCGLLC